MEYEKKYFGNGSGNFDDADFILQPNQWINMENCRVGSTDKGVVGTVESIGSTVLLSEPEPSVTFVQLGATQDEENRRIIYFLKNTTGPWDKIACYDIATDTFYDVLLATQVVGGLNFNKNNLIHSARVVDGKLYWTDGLNEPRKINIDAAIKMNDPSYNTEEVPYTAPIPWQEITIIKPPPPLAPDIQKDADASFENNFIANESFSFAFQYVYYDGEVSVVGTYSNASRLNKVTDDYNRIVVTMDILERIPETVRIVNLIVRVGNNAFVIKTWDKNITSEEIEIENQNSQIEQLTFNFYNDITGIAISSDQILKPFDVVPLVSKTLEVAKNRLFLGNNINGYDAPMDTSLSFELNYIDIEGAEGLSKTVIEVFMRDPFAGGTGDTYHAYYVFITEFAPVGYYALDGYEAYCDGCFSYQPLPTAPSSIAVSALIYRGATQDEALQNVRDAFGLTLLGRLFQNTSDMVDITGGDITTYDVFKSQSQYKIGVVFYDFAMRKCGVVTKPFSSSIEDPTLVSIPSRTYGYPDAVNTISWQLSNDNALTEIPEWAHYFTIVRTLNLRTRHFIQAINPATYGKYATKDVDGNYDFTNNDFVAQAIGIGIDTTPLVQAGLGYTFNEGDVCILRKEDNDFYVLSVIDQSGKYIIVNVPEGGIGDFDTFDFIYEIYTPYKASEQEPYYEVGEMYRIENPGTTARQYATLNGFLLPDAYAITRNFDSETYFAETMSPNDRFYNRWDNDGGKVNFVVKQGQSVKPNYISFSNVIIPGTQTNGLSTFEALNETDLPLENGPLQKLILTSKVQDEGDVMLAISTNETMSLYLGETQIHDNSGTTQFIATSNNVIGTKNALKGSFGTINPESVVEFRGNVYWVDVLNGKVIQYSLNGLFPISSYKMTRYWKQFCDQYNSMPREDIEDLGSRPFIFTAVDPHHWELLISVPRVLEDPPMGYLPDMPELVYPFDIWDGQAKTLVYKLNVEPNFWQGAYNFCAEGFVTVQNRLYSFKNGLLWQHNDDAFYGSLYDVPVKSRIMFISNQVPSRPKVYNNVSVEANLLPTLTYFMSLQPYQQVSNLQDFDWENKEGVIYSQIYRNVLTPSATGLVPNALVVGERMRTYALRIMLEFTTGDVPLELRFVNLGYSISLGHKT